MEATELNKVVLNFNVGNFKMGEGFVEERVVNDKRVLLKDISIQL